MFINIYNDVYVYIKYLLVYTDVLLFVFTFIISYRGGSAREPVLCAHNTYTHTCVALDRSQLTLIA